MPSTKPTPPEVVQRIRDLLEDKECELWWIAEQVGVSRALVFHIRDGRRHAKTRVRAKDGPER